MSKICTKCNHEWPDEFVACPLDGAPLVEKPQPSPSFNMNLGDANAVSGGIHMSDNHSISQTDSHNVDSHNVTTHTVDSHNVITNNITQIEREKSQEELLNERKIKYRECCKKALSNGVLTGEERLWLDEQRMTLNLPTEIASQILDETYKAFRLRSKSMGPVQRVQYNNFKHGIEDNQLQEINRLLPQIKVLANSFQEDELQFLYHFALAALNPQECVDTYFARTEDKYWLAFWTYIAYHKLGDVISAEHIMIDLDRWQDRMPVGNTIILGAFGALLDGDKGSANVLLAQIGSEEYSALLTNIIEALHLALNESDFSNVEEWASKHPFSAEHFFSSITENHAKATKQSETKTPKTEVSAQTPKADAETILKKYAWSEKCDEDHYYCLYNLYAIPKKQAKESSVEIMGASQDQIPDIVCLMAFCYEHGIGVERNDDLASRYYFYAANKNSTPAIRRLGDAFISGDFREEVNWSQSLEFYMRIAEVNVNSQFQAQVLTDIGMIYSIGDNAHGIPPAPYQAENYYTRAMQMGYHEAMSYLARLYMNSIFANIWPDGIAKAEKLIKELESVGKLRYDDAQELAVAYDNLSRKEDIPSALEWYNKSFDLWFNEYGASAGMVLFNIQYIYQYGRMVNSDLPVEKDIKKAYELYKAIYNKLESYKEEDYIIDDVIDVIMHIASIINDVNTNQYYSECCYYRRKWLELAAEKGNQEAEQELNAEDPELQRFWKSFVPLISEEKLFELQEEEIDIMSNPSMLLELADKSDEEQLLAYNNLLEEASNGNGKAGAYLSYFYIHGIIVFQDLREAEKRIMGSSNYQTDPILIQLLVDLYTEKGIPALAEIWKKKLNAL